MNKMKRDPKHWWIMGLLNVLAVEYPLGLYLTAGDGASRLAAAFGLVGITFVLAIADIFTIVGTLAGAK